MDRKKALLAVLVALGLLLVVRAMWPWLSNLGHSAGVVSFGRVNDDFDPVAQRLTPLRLADLDLKPGEYHPGRDPFRFAAKPPAPPPKPPAAQPAPRKPPPKPRARPASNRPAAPKPPPIDVKYLGSFGPETGKIAVFGDGTDIYNVRKGDILKEHFLLESINYESADLKYVNFPTLPATRLAAGQ